MEMTHVGYEHPIVFKEEEQEQIQEKKMIHFSHEHPLVFKADRPLKKKQKKKGKNNQFQFLYAPKINFFTSLLFIQSDYASLHKAWAKLPQEIIYSIYSAHPLASVLWLNLAIVVPVGMISLDSIIGAQYTICTFVLNVLRKIYKDTSNRTLSDIHQCIVQKEASFRCDASGQDLFDHYDTSICTTDHIKRCKDHNHDHPLTLACHLPLKFWPLKF